MANTDKLRSLTVEMIDYTHKQYTRLISAMGLGEQNQENVLSLVSGWKKIVTTYEKNLENTVNPLVGTLSLIEGNIKTTKEVLDTIYNEILKSVAQSTFMVQAQRKGLYEMMEANLTIIGHYEVFRHQLVKSTNVAA